MSSNHPEPSATVQKSLVGKVSLQGLKQTTRIHIKHPGLELVVNFDSLIVKAPEQFLRMMMWELQQELSKRGAKAS